jgi:hypothetical protein
LNLMDHVDRYNDGIFVSSSQYRHYYGLTLSAKRELLDSQD